MSEFFLCAYTFSKKIHTSKTVTTLWQNRVLKLNLLNFKLQNPLESYLLADRISGTLLSFCANIVLKILEPISFLIKNKQLSSSVGKTG